MKRSQADSQRQIRRKPAHSPHFSPIKARARDPDENHYHKQSHKPPLRLARRPSSCTTQGGRTQTGIPRV